MSLEGKLTPARFSSWCNELTYMDFTHRAMLLEGKLTLARFASWCNVFDENVPVLDGKILYEN